MNAAKTLGTLLLAAALLGGLAIAWWGWQTLDAASLFMGTRLC